MELRQRLVLLIESLELNPKGFAEKIGVGHSVIYHIIGERDSNRKNLPGYTTLQKIAEAFPTVNLRWLITGVGPMFDGACKVEDENEQSIPTTDVDSHEEAFQVVKLMKLIDLKTETITVQHDVITDLQSTITVKNEVIADLQSKIRDLERREK